MGGVYALDFGAVMLTAQAQGLVSPLLAEVLPDIEQILVSLLRSGGDEDADEEG